MAQINRMFQGAAIYYKSEDYNLNSRRVMGRQVASGEFLKALARYGTSNIFYGYTPNRQSFDSFCQQVNPWLSNLRRVQWIVKGNFKALAEVGTLYWPDPVITRLAWQRHYRNHRAYSLCGITHTLADKEVMAEIGNLMIAPVQPWDAIVCTSKVCKQFVERILDCWSDYLAQRLEGQPKFNIKLPVIPLGVDCSAFLKGAAAMDARSQFRQNWKIAGEDLVILFVGRLTFHAKAHPVPMYLAVEKAIKKASVKVHLVQVGWFADRQQESAFKQAAAQINPSANHIFLDAHKPGELSRLWAAADIFISLADNVQETFGLTPIEAMAAGLPVVVADWNGYRESVRHGIDGFRIPTCMPVEGVGQDLAADYYDNTLSYDAYIGHVSLLTAVDVEACTEALTRLFNSPELRSRMGDNGRHRAISIYDWKHIIPAYEELWKELNHIRAKEIGMSPANSARLSHPLCDDPFYLFNHYPTSSIESQQILSLGTMSNPASVQYLRDLWITNFGTEKRFPAKIIDDILTNISQKGFMSVTEVLERYGGTSKKQRAYLTRTLVYLLKFDILHQEVR